MLVTRRHLVIAVVMSILISVVGQNILAAAATQIIGRKPVGSVRGNIVSIRAGSLPSSNFVWIASPMGICTASPCVPGSGFFETGYYKTEGWPHIRQYAASQKSGSPANYEIWKDDNYLDEWTYFRYKSLYSNSAARWEAWRGLIVEYFRTDLNFTSGNEVACGGEAGDYNESINVECIDNQYKVGSGSWTSWIFSYQSPDFTPGGYCVKSIGADDFKAYGPGVQTCP